MPDLKALKRVAREHGFTVELSRRGNHWIFRNPDGKKVATAAKSASDYRSNKNTAAHLRAAGLPIPHKGGREPRERKPR